jgi:IPT/TIG domain
VTEASASRREAPDATSAEAPVPRTPGVPHEWIPPRGSSRTAIFFIQVGYLLALGAFVVAFRLDWIEPRRDFFGPVPFLVPWFGAVGAALLSLTAVFDHRGRDWNAAFCYWHWARPLVGAIVGTVSVLIFQSGILAVGGETPNQAETATPKNILFYLVAFVVGYREDAFRQLIKRLADLIFTTADDTRAAPVVEAVVPATVAPGTGTAVRVVGSGLAQITSATLGGREAVFAAGSDTDLTVTVPADVEPGATTLVLTGRDGSVATSLTVSEP